MHPRARRGLRLLAGSAVALGVLAPSVAFAPAASAAVATPKGAYWFTLYDLQKAWKVTEGAGVTVAVIDSGLQASLPALQGNLRPGIDLSGADPGDVTDDPLPDSPKYGHGTDMAAKIAGTGRGGGMVGIAPQAKILGIDAGTPDGIDSDAVAEGIRRATDAGAQVINLSIGGPGSCDPAEGAAIKYAYQHDVIVVASAGDSPGPVGSPANCPGALAIGGVDAAVKPWTKTPSGSAIDFVAPAYNLVNQHLDGSLSGPYPDNDGTSSAAAFTSGVFALLRAHFPHESARQIVTRALYNVRNGLGAGGQGSRAGDYLGYGMILPTYALTDAPPAGAKNPIYDRFAQALGPATSTPTSGTPSATSPSTSAPAATSKDSSSGFPAWAIVLVVVVVVAGLGVAFAASRRGRRGHGGPPPPGYGGPPAGYGR